MNCVLRNARRCAVAAVLVAAQLTVREASSERTTQTTTTLTISNWQSVLAPGFAIVKLSAAVKPATALGTVVFRDGTRIVGSCKLIAGSCSITDRFPNGTHTFTAAYGGWGSEHTYTASRQPFTATHKGESAL